MGKGTESRESIAPSSAVALALRPSGNISTTRGELVSRTALAMASAAGSTPRETSRPATVRTCSVSEAMTITATLKLDSSEPAWVITPVPEQPTSGAVLVSATMPSSSAR
jgi:hypothetical protein